MDYSVVAKNVLEKVGGEKNVASVTHCMTRLRFVLKDESIVNDEAVKAVDGVIGVKKKAGQYHVIIGNNVAKCYQELVKLGNFGDSSEASEKKEKQNPVMAVLDVISGSMAPVIPAIIGAGMIKILNILLGYAVPADSQVMQFMTIIGDCAFYFLPILVAFSAAKKFKTNPYLVAAVVAILIHPDFVALIAVEGGAKFLGIPVTSASYSSTLIPSILTAWVMSYVERIVDKITPSVTKNFLKPALIILISAPIAFLALGPVGYIIGNGLASVMIAIQTHASIVSAILMAAAMPFIVMTGMHWAFIPAVFAALGTPAGESLMLPAMLISNLAQGAACLAVAVKSKNSGLKQNAAASGISALVAGITEPGLYGVTMPLKKPLAAVCVSSGITGAIGGILKLRAFTFATPSLLSFPIFIDPAGSNTFVLSIIIAVISIVLTFVVTWVLGFEDPADEGQKKIKVETPTETENDIVYAPLNGTVVSLKEVNDATFADELVGKGAAILPSEGKVYAPFNGEMVTVFPTKHALGIKSNTGMEVLIHVGLDTVGLNGEHFKSYVKDGQKVKTGDLLLEFDMEAIKEAGYEVITPVVISNCAEYSDVVTLTEGSVKVKEPMLEAL